MGKPAVLAVGLCVLGACSSSVPDYPSYVAAADRAICQHQIDCGFLDPAYEKDCEQQFASFQGSNATIQATYDPAAGDACLATLRGALDGFGCRALLLNDLSISAAMAMACANALTGKVQTGGTCRASAECAGHGTCVITFANNLCTSACVAPAPVGQSCGGSNDCVDGAVCQFAALGPTCVSIGDVGAACSPADGTGDCKPGLACAPSADRKSASCSAPLAAGAPCEASPEARGSCGGELICDLLLTSPVCAPEKQLGEPCGSTDACGPHLLCTSSAAATATCLAPIPLGGACVGANQDAACLAPHRCVNGVCSAPPTIGQPCPDGACLEGFCDATKVCHAAIAVGGACDPTVTGLFQCQDGATCDMTTKTCKLCM